MRRSRWYRTRCCSTVGGIRSPRPASHWRAEDALPFELDLSRDLRQRQPRPPATARPSRCVVMSPTPARRRRGARDPDDLERPGRSTAGAHARAHHSPPQPAALRRRSASAGSTRRTAPPLGALPIPESRRSSEVSPIAGPGRGFASLATSWHFQREILLADERDRGVHARAGHLARDHRLRPASAAHRPCRLCRRRRRDAPLRRRPLRPRPPTARFSGSPTAPAWHAAPTCPPTASRLLAPPPGASQGAGRCHLLRACSASATRSRSPAAAIRRIMELVTPHHAGGVPALVRRAVRDEDYREHRRAPARWVQRAGAVSRWTGSWLTTFVTPDPREHSTLTPAHRAELERAMDCVRQAGREVVCAIRCSSTSTSRSPSACGPSAYFGQVQEARDRAR